MHACVQAQVALLFLPFLLHFPCLPAWKIFETNPFFLRLAPTELGFLPLACFQRQRAVESRGSGVLQDALATPPPPGRAGEDASVGPRRAGHSPRPRLPWPTTSAPRSRPGERRFGSQKGLQVQDPPTRRAPGPGTRAALARKQRHLLAARAPRRSRRGVPDLQSPGCEDSGRRNP